MLSSSTASMRRSSASRSCSNVSTSSSIFTRCPTPARARSTAARMPPAMATWLSLMSRPSSSPNRWLLPPPPSHRVFLRRPQARRGLPACAHPRARAADRLHDRRGGRGDARLEPAQEIRHLPQLGGEHAARRPAHRRDFVASPNPAAIRSFNLCFSESRDRTRRNASREKSRPATTPGCRATSAVAARASAGTMASGRSRCRRRGRGLPAAPSAPAARSSPAAVEERSQRQHPLD